MFRKMLSLICIVLGALIFLYPTLNDRYESYQQQKIMNQWQESLQIMDQISDEERETVLPAGTDPTIENVETAEAAHAAEAVNSADAVVPSPQAALPSDKPVKPVVMQAAAKPTPMPKNVEGVLKIEKINLKLPILTDATVKNLKVSVASIANTGKPGEVGNYAIAGHRNLTYGKNFNRLDEVEAGDVIEVETGSKQFVYIVEEKQYVLPTDISVLKGNGTDKEITLITCHPMDNPTHRLIIKGKIVESSD
ncbi:sortase [Paenibacillus sp. GCM10023248]|uniref:class D sortase n=1 Tax=unclassified Paenibacillus TaxID=185978 RepID=UPI002379171C|nr:sortase [Paenibacillus sp. MAHUQ-63]MDD9272050.1 sortase [Paenibacillus sp. MAHUQ-63]